MGYASTHPEKVSTQTLAGYLKFLAVQGIWGKSIFQSWVGQFPVLSPHLGRSDSSLWVIFKTLRERALSPFQGFSWAPSVGLKRVLVGLWCQAIPVEKLQGEVYQKVNQLIPHCQFHPRLLWGIRCLKAKGAPGPLHSVFLSFYHMRGPCLLLFFFCFSRGQSSPVFPLPPVSTLFLPQWVLTSLQVTHLPGIQCHCQKSGVSFCIFIFLLLFPVEHFKSNIYQLRRVHSKYTI